MTQFTRNLHAFAQYAEAQGWAMIAQAARRAIEKERESPRPKPKPLVISGEEYQRIIEQFKRGEMV